MNKYLIALSAGSACLFSNNLTAADKESSSDNNKNRPNIIYLMADDHQAMALGCTGNKEVHTPTLDALASKGILFDKAYATSPICMPSRATVMTGMYEFKTGCNFNTGSLSVRDWQNNSYPELLRKNGYLTAFAGKWGFKIEDNYDYKKDFDFWGGFQGSGQGSYKTSDNSSLLPFAERYKHVTRALGAFGRDFIKKAAESGKPFCLSISFKAPHKPHCFIDVEDKKLFKNVTFSKPANYGDEFLKNLPPQPKLSRQRVQWKEWDPEHYQEHTKAYYQLIAGIDAAVKMILDELKEQNIDRKTIVIYTSDNGYAMGAHGFQGKSLPYEEQARIPLIIYDPQSKKHGVKSHSLVANIDYAPTILDYAGVSIPPKMDGKSLKKLVRNNPEMKIHDSIMLVQNWAAGRCDIPKGVTIVSGAWKYIYWCYGDKNISPAEELYNLMKDPHETENILKTKPASDTLSALQKKYDDYICKWKQSTRPKYSKYGILFDRNIPWQQKSFKGAPGKFLTKEMYKEYVGAEPPDGLIKIRKHRKNRRRKKHRKK